MLDGWVKMGEKFEKKKIDEGLKGGGRKNVRGREEGFAGASEKATRVEGTARSLGFERDLLPYNFSTMAPNPLATIRYS